MTHRESILNAFKPGAEIEHPAAFAGRRDEILNLLDALYVDGSCPVIYGDRGLGKTSLALQVERIALGDVELLNELDCSERALPDRRRFTTFWISCSDSIVSKNDILQRIINNAEGYDRLESLPSREVVGHSTKRKINLKFFEAETEKQYQPTSPQKFSQLDIEERLTAVAETVCQKTRSRVLFIIDELDRVRDTSGLASFIKNTSTASIKFLLIGIAQNVSSLLYDHTSLERKLIPVRIRKMKPKELESIITKTMALLGTEENRFNYDKEAIQATVAAADGFPWFVHVLAQEALRRAYDDGRTSITVSDVNAAIKGLASSRFAQQFSDTYQMAVKDSYYREIVLRFFARWRDDDIPTSEIYPLAKELGVSNTSIYKKDLTLATYGRVLVTPPDQPRGIVRFRNAMFKRYVSLRGSIYGDVKENVDKAWANKFGEG